MIPQDLAAPFVVEALTQPLPYFLFAQGWPAYSHQGWGTWHREDVVIHGLRATDNNWILAVQPLWPGFAINTVFYAAILWLLFAVPGWTRRLLRARRGQCPACAYPIGTSNVCTECGAAVRRVG